MNGLKRKLVGLLHAIKVRLFSSDHIYRLGITRRLKPIIRSSKVLLQSGKTGKVVIIYRNAKTNEVAGYCVELDNGEVNYFIPPKDIKEVL